jgi:protein-tyrosine phosphatase
LTENAEELCLEGTKVLLLELPVLQKPAFLREVLTALVQKGITPLIAHVERYQYVAQDPRILADWMELGALIQVNAQSVLDGGLARKMVRWGLCHVIASDAHSLEHRPANLPPALELIAKCMGRMKAQELEQNAAALYDGMMIPTGPIRTPKRVLGLWL